MTRVAPLLNALGCSGATVQALKVDPIHPHALQVKAGLFLSSGANVKAGQTFLRATARRRHFHAIKGALYRCLAVCCHMIAPVLSQAWCWHVSASGRTRKHCCEPTKRCCKCPVSRAMLACSGTSTELSQGCLLCSLMNGAVVSRCAAQTILAHSR